MNSLHMEIKDGLPRKARNGEFVALDVEMFQMSKPHRADGSFAVLSVAFGPTEIFQITDYTDIPEVLEALEDGVWVMQNALFDLRVLRRYADVSQRYIHDTMLIDMDLFGGWYSRFSLKNLARRWLGVVRRCRAAGDRGSQTGVRRRPAGQCRYLCLRLYRSRALRYRSRR